MIDEKIFPFLAEKGHVISLVGGGGKTTLMYNLAAHCARKGWRVLAATTTHIMQPPGGVWAQTDAELAAELLCVPQDAQLTPELLANLLASEAGGRKAVGDRSFYVVLNQVDTKEQAALARQVADILKKNYRISCATSHFEKGERA